LIPVSVEVHVSWGLFIDVEVLLAESYPSSGYASLHVRVPFFRVCDGVVGQDIDELAGIGLVLRMFTMWMLE
jgi:hypothetical protein